MVTVVGIQRSHLGQLLLGALLSLLILMAGISPAMAENFDRQNLRQMDFSNQDLRGNNYTRADMAEVNLSHANLQGVRLFDTTLARANLEGADLRGATLDGARFIRANLTNAVLAGAYAIDTDFRGAIIDGADFTDVLLDPKVNKALCEVAKGTNPLTGRNTRDTLYCP